MWQISNAEETKILLPETLHLRNMSLKLKWIDRFSLPDFEDIPSVLFARPRKLNQNCSDKGSDISHLSKLLFGPRLLLSSKKVS